MNPPSTKATRLIIQLVSLLSLLLLSLLSLPPLSSLSLLLLLPWHAVQAFRLEPTTRTTTTRTTTILSRIVRQGSHPRSRSSSIRSVLVLRGGGGEGERKPHSKKSTTVGSKTKTTTKTKTKTKTTATATATATATTTKAKKKKKKESTAPVATKPTTCANDQEQDSGKEQQQDIYKVFAQEADTATMLGNAIRDRASELLASDDSRPQRQRQRSNEPFLLDQMDQTLTSIGFGLGASDRFASWIHSESETTRTKPQDRSTINEATGGVEASTTAVLVHYFLKSHGGAHAVQCICSLLATLTGLGAVMTPLFLRSSTAPETAVPTLVLVQMRRCLTFAMMKHVSGMLAAAVMTARAVPEIGLRNARLWIHDLVQDPISQYVFYTACLLLWLPPTTSAMNQPSNTRFWQAFGFVPFILLGPVLLREIIHTMFVISDVLVLWVITNNQNNPNPAPATSDNDDDDDNDSKKTALAKTPTAVIPRLLRLCQAVVDAFMSILVTPQVWRSANALKRQAILAKLVGRMSLALEVMVGLLLSVDALVLLLEYLMMTSTSTSMRGRPSLGAVLTCVLCAHFYLQFLWIRRRKISKLATHILRGGAAAQFPLYIMDVLLDPISAMGLNSNDDLENAPKNDTNDKVDDDDAAAAAAVGLPSKLTWKDWVLVGLGLDEVFPISSNPGKRRSP